MALNNMKHPEVPAWLLTAAKNSYCASKDILQIFGFKSLSSLNSAIQNGVFPNPDPYDGNLSIKSSNHRWLVSTVLNEIKRRKLVFERKEP